MSDIQFPSSFSELPVAAEGELRVEVIWDADMVPGDLADRIEGANFVISVVN